MLNIRLVIPGMPVSAPDPYRTSLGGSETAGLQLAKTLARKGNRVTVHANVERGFHWCGVNIVPLAVYLSDESARSGDLLIIQRDPAFLTLPFTARRVFLWLHDQPTPDMGPTIRSVLSAIDRIMVVSEWQAQELLDAVPGLRREKLLVTRNGIEPELIDASTRGVPRNPMQLLYTARQERGLEVLLHQVLPGILAQEPEATLHIAAYDDANSAAEPFYRRLRERAARFGDRVVQHGALAKRDLYRLMAGSALYLYPTPGPTNPTFAETSCITAMEAGACGVPWISTDAGALPETVGDAGVIVPLNGAMHAGDGDVPERLAAEAVRIMRDPEYADQLRAAGKARAALLRWDQVADQVAAAAVENPMVRAVRSIGTAPVVAICMPTRGTPNLDCVNSAFQLRELLSSNGIQSYWVALAGDNLVPRARNLIAALALSNPDVTHLFWLDDDIGFAAEDVQKLLDFDVDFVCGLYPRKKISRGDRQSDYVFVPLDPSDPIPPSDPATGLLEVATAGTGFMLTKRTVYEQMAKAYPQDRISVPDDRSDPSQIAALPWLHNYFPVYVEDGALIGEDYTFCRRWRALGGKVLVDTEVKLIHHGAYAFQGNPAKMFRKTAA